MSSKPIAIFVQAHYPDIWNAMSELVCERVRFPFRLILTTSGAASHLRVPKSAHLVATDVLEVENRGRDVRPFLMSLAQADDFEIGLKLHTKKSPQRADGARWLADLLDSLMPPSGTSEVVNRFQEADRVGLIAPAGFCLPVEPWILQNERAMNSVALASGRPLEPGDLDDCYFPAGSMFWFRRRALASLAIPPILELFEEEAGQLDGTTAHGVERFFAVETRRNGFLTIAMPALMLPAPSPSTPDRLMAETKRHTEEPNALFPGPYIEARSATPVPVLPLAPPDGSSPLRETLKSLFRALPKSMQDGLRQLIRR